MKPERERERERAFGPKEIAVRMIERSIGGRGGEGEYRAFALCMGVYDWEHRVFARAERGVEVAFGVFFRMEWLVNWVQSVYCWGFGVEYVQLLRFLVGFDTCLL